MNKETKQCQNCKNEFTIEPEDFAFYEKINVPPPTFCPECRIIRRMMFRNLKTLYKRKVIGNEKEVFSMFSPDTSVKVYDEKLFWSDEWNAMEYGRDYEWNKPFFEQLKELLLQVPWPHRYSLNVINSEYSINVVDVKNSYLVFNSGYLENVLYAVDALNSKDCLDVDKISNCELCYEIYDSEKCNQVFLSVECRDCHDIFFSKNLVDCHDCFGCVNLRHKKYHIFNKSYSKDEYFRKLKEFDVGSYQNILKFQKGLEKDQFKYPVKYIHGHSNVSVDGDYLEHCKNVHYSFASQNLEDCSYCQLILFLPSKDSYDMAVAGGELCYEIEEAGGYNIQFCWFCSAKKWANRMMALSDIQYTILSLDSSNLFGCVGLRNKKYCILNKRYPEDEYFKLREKIIAHMDEMPYTDKKGRAYKYGEFFPVELSPFGYNETIANEYFPLTKEEAEKKGYNWRDSEKRTYEITKKPEDLPDHIKDVKDDILNQIIGCVHEGKCNEQCTEAFKIIKPELEFYRKMNLPLFQDSVQTAGIIKESNNVILLNSGTGSVSVQVFSQILRVPQDK